MTFGLITEGPTDQIIIENILLGYFNDPNIDVRQLQPKENESGNWDKVLKYCASEEFKGTFESGYIDYVIIQIDTDSSQDWKVKPSEIGADADQIPKLLTEVQTIITDLIGQDFYNLHSNRIIFAISVHSVECWLLPFYTNQKSHYSKIVKCLNCLNLYLNPAYGFTIDAKNLEYYRKASKDLRKSNKLKAEFKKNPSLKVFVENLETRFKLQFA